MNKVLLQNEKTVGYYTAELSKAIAAEEDYTVYSAPLEASDDIVVLYQSGFVFVDRSILTEISLSKYQPRTSNSRKFEFIFSDDWRPEILYFIAEQSFDTDRRFAVDLSMKDKRLKNELLLYYMTELKLKDCKATCCLQNDEIIGFNIWNVREQRARVFLGAMADRYKGTGLALYLYSYTMQYMKENGASVLGNTVFSSNASALNLHTMLGKMGGGIKFRQCEDWYIKNKGHIMRG